MKRPVIPPVPSVGITILGPIEVRRPKSITSDEGTPIRGSADFCGRVIEVEEGLAPVVALQTYGHEWTHIVLEECGITLPPDVLEQVCDAIGTARAREAMG